LRTLAIPLRQGRWFDRRDGPETPRVTVISEAMASREFPGENPVGRQLYHGNHNVNPPMEIIGVVADVRYEGLDRPGSPAFYELSDQVPFRPMWLLVRTAQPAQTVIAPVRSQIRSLDPDVPVDRIGTMTEALSESVSLPRFRSFLMTAFAAS